MGDLRTAIRNIADIAVIDAAGYLDSTTAPEMAQALETALSQKRYKIAIDITRVEYVSSAGWAVFVSEIRTIRDNGGELALVGMSPEVYDVYELMEFSTILRSFKFLEEALRYFGVEQSLIQRMNTATKKPPLEISENVLDLSFNDKVAHIVKGNPYYSEKDIRETLASAQYGEDKASFFAVKKALKDLDLDTVRKRFDYANS